MTCLIDPEIIAFLDGVLPLEARRRVEMHLDACPLCFNVMAAVGRASSAGPRGPEGIVPGPLLGDGEQRYVVGPEIARGGMGRILAGEDRLLGRPVALKLLRRSSASLARRFLREQRITARLQHPAIVPVYDAGVLADGEPFFVMRLVKGRSLDRIAARAASLGERLQLLPAVLAVVDAVAYAHGEGVVHRDLKPQNVLVGPFGEVVVLDWGLARDTSAGTEHEVEAHHVDSGDAGEQGVTRDGERLGTVAYMAPEQAAGQGADARSDVYGLGAILYHVLTGRPPHAERTTSLSTKAVQHAAPALTLLAPEVPPDLVTIVGRAMASEPGVRYASALELAADLKRWQAGRLVEAHRYSLRELLRRFGQRYRAPLLVGAVAFVVLVAVGGVSVWRIFAERGRALAAQAVAERQRVAAEKLVQFTLDDLRPRVWTLGRLDVLADVARAVIAYQDSAPSVADSEAWLRRAQAAALAGDVAYDMGDLKAAEESYRRSGEAATGAGDTEATTLVRCRVEIRLGEVRVLRSEFVAAESHYKTCEGLTRGAADAKLRTEYLTSKLGLAHLSMVQGSPVARTLLEEGLAAVLAEAGDPGSENSRLVLVFRAHLADMLLATGEWVAAREMALARVALARARVEAGPDARNRYVLAIGLSQLGHILRLAGELAAAERHLVEALDLLRLLLAQDPLNADWQQTHDAASAALAQTMKERGDDAAALALQQSTIESIERRIVSSPDDTSLHENLGLRLRDKAGMLTSLGRTDSARREYRRALDIFERLAKSVPDGPYDARVVDTRLLLGQMELGVHQIAAGRELLLGAIDALRRRLAVQATPQNRCLLAEALASVAEHERGAAARRRLDEARELLKGQNVEDPRVQLSIKAVDEVHRAMRGRR